MALPPPVRLAGSWFKRSGGGTLPKVSVGLQRHAGGKRPNRPPRTMPPIPPQGVFDVLCTPIDSLASAHAVKQMVVVAPSAVADHWSLNEQLRLYMDVLQHFKYSVPDEVMQKAFTAQWLPLRVRAQAVGSMV